MGPWRKQSNTVPSLYLAYVRLVCGKVLNAADIETGLRRAV